MIMLCFMLFFNMRKFYYTNEKKKIITKGSITKGRLITGNAIAGRQAAPTAAGCLNITRSA